MKNYNVSAHWFSGLVIILMTSFLLFTSCKDSALNLPDNNNKIGAIKMSSNNLMSVDPCPVTSGASQEAKNVLKYLYSLTDSVKMLAGQHNWVQTPLKFTNEAITNTGKTPAIWGSDFSYGAGLDGPTGFRQKMIVKAIAQSDSGAIVVLSYHQVRPDLPDSAGFSGVQSAMTAAEFDSLLTVGSALHTAWKAKWDVIAGYLQQLKVANVPVVFRPYHEMNGGHFWWGKKTRFPELFQMTYNYLVTTKGLNNILWMWNANRINTYAGAATPFYPGDNYVDILATDVYWNDYNITTYNELVTLAGVKPIALGEVGVPPSATILSAQPRYIWAMEWSRPTDYTTWPVINTFYTQPKVYTLDEVVNPFPISNCIN